MDLSTALRILELSSKSSDSDAEAAKRKHLQALHPDKHPPDQREVFTKMTRDVIEAYDVVAANLGTKDGKPRNAAIEHILFEEETGYSVFGKTKSDSLSLMRYSKRYAHDKVLAIAVTSIDCQFVWYTTNQNGERVNHQGCAVYLVVLNRTSKPADGLYLELRQNFCYPRRGVKRREKIRCARSDCYRGGNG